jgi:hypothetical protein
MLIIGKKKLMNNYLKLPIFSKKYGCKFVTIDKEDFNKIKNYKLRLSKTTNGFYVNCRLKGSKLSKTLHSIIMETKFIDHINGNPLDNRKSNLRNANYFTNNRNSAKRKDYKYSKYKGVGKNYRNQWIARIQFNNKRILIGTFKTALEAAKAYDIKAKELHKEFARLNFYE